MEKKRIDFELFIYNSLEDLADDEKKLMQAAQNAKENAYAPYSNYKVGAAVRMENGEIVIGNNQENACYPSGLCAERVAIYYAGAQYPGMTIKAIAIAVSNLANSNRPAAPCGSCRQSISEYEVRQQAPIKIVMMADEAKIFTCHSIADLLPLAFDSSHLQ